ncbi:uncharacterized protein BJ171DRAFT_422078 [Polychytrium aggregatum]|uniref:uncharacterized protein n=1 Tax=Polychytrium aggregatum TaxID=110093 RepID=UPI0022FE32EC|nr:uncharacterized protein BJ171DRAFT_422078 [Polychytrium aggregatum]KAI9206410.1 hypothetical protein BJ171DRAFT_422078 [Polychytrium aggregatum]
MASSAPVVCPCCNKPIPSALINEHLDSQCSLFVQPSAAASSGPRSPRQSWLPKPGSPPPSKAPPKRKLTSASQSPSSSVPPLSPSASSASAPLKPPFSPPETHLHQQHDIEPYDSQEVDQEEPSPDEARPDRTPPASLPPKKKPRTSHAPLADLARPTDLGHFYGQPSLVGDDCLLSRLIQSGRMPSILLWGPPGCGKTTLARLIGRTVGNSFYREMSGATHSIADVRKIATEARNQSNLTGQRPILFMDEIHRFTKLQQDFFLKPVEEGNFTLIAATTENPSFRINSALLSRCRVFVLNKIDPEAMKAIIMRAVRLKEENAIGYLSILSDGDARSALNSLEMVVDSAIGYKQNRVVVTLDQVKQILQKTHMLYDKDGEEHYNLISAFHKSVRGSDEDAALYWLSRMIFAGEDVLYVARRMIRIASEDIGLGDSQALPLAVATYQSCQIVGMPECDVMLAHCAAYLARAPKNVDVYKALKFVRETIDSEQGYPVPFHLRNAPTRLMEQMGYGNGYKYNPDYVGQDIDQYYLPEELHRRGWKCMPKPDTK